MKIIYTKHAKETLVYRKIKKTFVNQTLKNPDYTITLSSGKTAYFKDFGRNFLKVSVSPEENPVVITFYWFAKKRLKK